MVIALIALFVSLGGTAAALSGSNTVFTDDIANDTQPASGGNPAGGLVAPDLRAGSVGTSEVANGTVSVLDTNKVIPSGATVTGAFNDGDTTAPGSFAELLYSVDFHGLRAPTPLTDADINFDDAGISATAAASDEESSGCTGGIGVPTAPPGKVCIYLSYEAVTDGIAQADTLGFGSGFTGANDKGFIVDGVGPSFAWLAGTWAYRAP